MMEITFFGAFIAGLLSFASPCVLPLIPAYISFLGGASLSQLTEEDGIDAATQKRVFYSAIAFVLGFSTVFISLGATATAISAMIAQNSLLLGQIAGTIIVIFGLHYMGVFRIGFLNFEKRFHLENKPAGLIGSYILGLAFAFGWTPCVGPILASVLMVAASGDSVSYGISLLTVYAAGLGIPFLAAAFAVKPFMKFLSRFKKQMRKIEITIGVLLIITGIAIFTGDLAEASNWLLETFPAFTQVG
ncbi:MAG: cytochrome c biogenesis protein CcdA [Rhodospirillaceae bacterium]|jgi:cytochrome c-type biogenesis protein|nr:cytochrome c biogenesis protein CcdA [Rhodospirillaceae bacterium]MBT4589908.1 cytochrome c biogenesis protein CcdA [Rhodospirillaceae bacterium]MBT4940164.1 cytochrome c biogenesis protein CcdA [Rhodospirillaceae bacterium]MBT5939392.1 cytochrome c biogenesis protein CcdA [Rhodospirillaceae bacterium]MBT7956968.1 cytochrome c biogenesis protein CcdA [Rhodospirillaceae bacterium]